MKIEFMPQGYCDTPGDVVHNHFDCPACGQEGAGTDIYMGVWEWFDDDQTSFKCESCGAIFELVSGSSESDYVFEERKG